MEQCFGHPVPNVPDGLREPSFYGWFAKCDVGSLPQLIGMSEFQSRSVLDSQLNLAHRDADANDVDPLKNKISVYYE